MGKNNRVGGFSFLSNPSIFLLLPCMTLPEMDAKARQQFNEWWVEQNSSVVHASLSLSVCVCVWASVCGHLWRNCEADGTVSLSSMHSWAPEASCRHLFYCSSVHKCCTLSNIVLTQSHPPKTNWLKKCTEIETQHEIYSHCSLSVKHAKTTTKQVQKWYE